MKNAIKKEYAKYVGLSVVGMVCVSCYVFVDTFFIAMALESDGLTALNLSIPVFSIVHGIGLMISIGGATQYTILKNKGEDFNTIFTHSLVVAGLAAIVFMIVGLFFTTPLAKTFGAAGTILPMVTAYIQTILYFSPVLILNILLIVFIRNDHNPKLAMAAMVVGSFSNIVLDYIFLFPLSMGMFGAALATGLSLTLSVAVLSLHFLTKNNQLHLRKCKLKIKQMMNIMPLGFSAFINELAFAVSLIVFNLIILGIEGNIGVAAFGIVANIAFVVIAMFTGVAQGIQPLISKGYGSGDRVLVKLILQYAIITVVSLGLAIYGIAYWKTNAIVAAFNNEANVVLAFLAANGIRIYFIGLIFAGVNIVVAAFFSAVDRPKMAVTISILRSFAVMVPMALMLSAMFGMNGVWASFVSTEFIVSMLSILFLYMKFKKIGDFKKI
ncbi:MAG: MATE family efflux transporter [Treponema sp.]|nr:MATE family efflux transporter [Treponema sp.]